MTSYKACFVVILFCFCAYFKRKELEMTIFHDEIEIEDFEYEEDEEMYYYPCPCGDRFQISKEELMAGEEVATCPSCSLVVKVIYDLEKFKAEAEEIRGEDGDKETVKA